jgi:hypothetical protein
LAQSLPLVVFWILPAGVYDSDAAAGKTNTTCSATFATCRSASR